MIVLNSEIILFLFLFSLYVILVFFFLFVPWIFGAPFEPTPIKIVKDMIALSSVKKRQKMVDIGSGDGRIVVEFAKKGIEAHGYEINPFLVLLSIYNIRKAGLKGRAFIHWKNFWKEDLSKFDIIVVFQIGYLMNKLRKKIEKEKVKKVKIVSRYWKFPRLKPIKQKREKRGRIYLYEIK